MEMNGKTLNGIELKVSLARRQPERFNLNKSSSSSNSASATKNEKQSSSASNLSTPEAWSAFAAETEDGVETGKQRSMISYDDDIVEDTI